MRADESSSDTKRPEVSIGLVDLERAKSLLLSGGILAHPTETVYGLGCLLRPDPLRALSTAKERGASDPFLILAPNTRWVCDHFSWGQSARVLAQEFWPGPLTLVLTPRKTMAFPPEVCSELGEVAVRVSSHQVVSTLVLALGEAMTSTSANRRGASVAATADSAAAVMAGLDPGVPVGWLDGGAVVDAIPSTIVRPTSQGIDLVRVGVIPADALRLALSTASGFDGDSMDAAR